MEFIEAQRDFSGRVAGSEAERMCQNALAGRMDRLGMEAVVEGAVCPPQLPHILFLHAVFFLGALLLSLFRPLSGAAVSALTLLSFWGELRGRPRVLRRLLLKRITGNMVARFRNREASGKVVLVAHADVASASRLFLPWARRFTIHHKNPIRTMHPGTLVLVAGAVQSVGALEQWSRPDISLFALTAFLGAAVVHGLRAGLALELVITTSRSGWRPSPWRATAAVGSGALHLLATGLTAGALVSADLPDEVFGDRECYPSGHCSGTPASPLGGALIAQTAFLVFSVPYALAEIVVGVHAAKRSRPDRQRAARVQLSIGSSGVLLSGRF